MATPKPAAPTSASAGRSTRTGAAGAGASIALLQAAPMPAPAPRLYWSPREPVSAQAYAPAAMTFPPGVKVAVSG